MKHTKTFYKLAALLVCLFSLLSLCACGETVENKGTVYAMDTAFTVVGYGKNGEKGVKAAESVIASMDAALDPEVETSMVYKMNHANGQNTQISGQIAEMIETARTVYKKSGGALDITIYPLVKLWGFPDSKYYVPSEEEAIAMRDKLCFDELVLTPFPSSGSYSVKMPVYAEVTFAAVAKGCASQNAIDAMRQAGVTSGVVSAGGNVQTLGRRPNGTNWDIAITDPAAPNTYLGILNVGEAAIVTSGSYQRSFTNKVDGKTYHHLLRPNTGFPTTNSLRSVTVVCEDGTLADCLSTAMYVLGETGAMNYWRANGGFDMIMVTTGDEIICTSGLIEQFTVTNRDYTLRYAE